MKVRPTVFALTVLSMPGISGWLQAQQPPPQPGAAPADSGLLIQTETKQVLIDAVVTDKKGNYVSDLKTKDFHVQEDGKDQPIKSFSFEADPVNGGSGRTHYLVLMFDNASMNTGDQTTARQAASKFIETNAGPDRQMEVVNFSGDMRVEQNFTADAERLKTVVNAIKFSAVSTNAGTGPGAAAASDFAIRAMLQNLRTLAKGLGSVPGRKILVLFSAGFKLSPEYLSEATATINECNKANVAIYPVDVRGLTTGGFSMAPKALLETPKLMSPLVSFDFKTVALMPMPPFAAQARGGTGGGGGAVSAPSAPSSGSRSSPSAPASTPSAPTTAPSRTTTAPPTGGTANNPNANNNANNNRLPPGGVVGGCPGGPGGAPNNGGFNGGGSLSQNMGNGMQSPCASRNLIPKVPDTSTPNQQIMFMLADGTGGFVIHDSNDLLGGLQKIGKEQNQYYLLGYTPPDAKQGACHTVHVKVDRSGLEVRARTGYCSSKPMDVLSGNPIEKTLETKIAAQQPGPLVAPPAGRQGASMRLPFFYAAPNVARVNLAMDLPSFGLKFEKKKDTQHAEVNFLGIAYTPEGAVAARFSDTLKLDFASKEEADDAKKLPLHYENQFEIASGKYTFKIAFSEGGENVGKLEMPLEIDSFKSDQLAFSGLALSKEYHRTAELGGALDMAIIEDKRPLIADGLQIVPAGNTTFSKSDLAIFYFELYEPLLASADPKNPPLMGIQMRVLDRKTGDMKSDTGMVKLEPPPPLGNTVVPFGWKMPVGSLAPGAYQLELTAIDSAEQKAKRTADFDIQ